MKTFGWSLCAVNGLSLIHRWLVCLCVSGCGGREVLVRIELHGAGLVVPLLKWLRSYHCPSSSVLMVIEAQQQQNKQWSCSNSGDVDRILLLFYT